MIRFVNYFAAFGVMAFASSAAAATYYVAPSGTNGALSTDATAPGNLDVAAAQAPGGSTVILEDGTYTAPRSGVIVQNSTVTFRSQKWHGARIVNPVAGDIVGPGKGAIDDVWQGVVFGPSTGLGWSGGGGAGWKFMDCVFDRLGGVGAGDNCLFLNDLFTDASSNSFDFGGKNQEIKNCIIRRGNRACGDDDSIGSKEDFTTNFMVDGLVAYDTAGSALWYDTSNDGWTVKNSTFFANHGGNNWYYLNIAGGTDGAHFQGNGQDGQGLVVGMNIKGFSGTAANIGKTSVITSVSGSNPQTFTASPALPAAPVNGDTFLIQQGNVSTGDGFTSEANDNGTFINNVTYSNTDRGFYDHASGGTRYGGTGGLIVEGNLFAYDGESYNYTPDGRDDGPAIVQHNRFKFHPGTSQAIGAAGGSMGAYPGGLGIAFDYNIYDPDTEDGAWANWLPGSPPVVAGGLTADSHAAGQDYLQNPATWNQDQHSLVAKVPFWGTAPQVSIWPAAKDTNWSDIYMPNNTFGLTNSIHQIDDTDGAVNNTIDAALAGHHPGDIVVIPVSAHQPLQGTTAQIYDLNGRWMTLNVAATDQASFLATVAPYVSCAPGNKTVTYKIRVLVDSVDPYNMEATYTPMTGTAPPAPKLLAVIPGDKQANLMWQPSTGATGYTIVRSKSPNGEGTATETGTTVSSFVDNGLTDGTTYYYRVRATNSYGHSDSSNAIAVAPMHVTASLTGTSVPVKSGTAYSNNPAAFGGLVLPEPTKINAVTTFDLTALGTIDWRQWGNMSGSNHKASGGGQITELTEMGNGKYGRWQPLDFATSWTDSASGFNDSAEQNFLWCNTVQNSGWTFTVPADTTQRELGMLWGGSNDCGVSLVAHLSDGSAPDYTNAYTVSGEPSGTGTHFETITYAAGKPGQTLTITLLKTDAASGPSVDLEAAWLR